MTDIEQPEIKADAGPTAPEHKLETRILRGAGWVAIGFGSRQLITWLSMLVLVRLLEPDAFGVVALALTLVSALEYLRGSGVWAALVFRRGEVEEASASTFVYLLVSSVPIYGLWFATAPLLAGAFDAPELTGVLRVLALIVVFGGLSVVPAALLERDLNYSATARVHLGGAAAQVIAGLSLAFAGAGVWSLVAGQVAASAFEAAALWYLIPRRPSIRRASVGMLREVFRYGRFASTANIATFLSGTVDTIVVGRMLGATAVGFYSVAFRVATISESIFSYVIVKAMFPAFSIVQQDRDAFRQIFVRHAQRVALLVLPVAIFVALSAKPIVLALLGDEWSPVVTPVRILAVFGFVRALSATANEVFRGAGRPELAMWFSTANVVLLVPTLVVLTRWLELDGAALAVLISLTVTTLPALIRMMRLVGISANELTRMIRPSLFCSAVLALTLVILARTTSPAAPVTSLVAMLGGGLVAYLGSTAVFARSLLTPMWLDLRGTRT